MSLAEAIGTARSRSAATLEAKHTCNVRQAQMSRSDFAHFFGGDYERFTP